MYLEKSICVWHPLRLKKQLYPQRCFNEKLISMFLQPDFFLFVYFFCDRTVSIICVKNLTENEALVVKDISVAFIPGYFSQKCPNRLSFK